MKLLLFAAGVLALSAGPAGHASGPASPDTQDRRRADYDFNISLNHQSGPLTSCDQIEATTRDAYLARGEEVMTVPRAAATLRIAGARNGGLHVRGAERADYQVKLCKFAAGDSMADAAARLDRVKLSVENGVVTTTGPNEGGGWQAQMIVQAPPDAQLSLDAANGPLSIEGTSGRVTARALNGPLSVRGCSGEIDVDAQNGPLAISDNSGTVRASARNGPLSVELSGAAWDGTGLEAHVNNGPLSLRLPPAYQSGVEVNMPSHGGPFTCRAASCRDALRSWDDQSRRLQFGGSTPVVRISAVNGPVAIR